MKTVSSSKPESTPAWRQLRKTIGKNILHFRRQRKLSLFRLAKLADVNPLKLDDYEMGYGTTSLYNVTKIAHVLKVSVGELMVEEE